MNGLAASDSVIIPMESGSRFSFDGVDDFLDTVRLVKTVNPRLDILGVLITKHDQRHNVCRAVVSSITDRFGEMRFATAITSSTATRKAEFNGLTVIQYDRRCTAAKDYVRFARELLGRLGMEPKRRRPELAEEPVEVPA
jgi:chromosome partitioning protein